jgi:ATP-binding cassette subfamily B protein RaxB
MSQPRFRPAPFFRARVPVIFQSEAAECGLACLAMVAGFHGFRADLSSLRRCCPLSLRGVTLGQLINVANELRLTTRALRLDLKDLSRLALPAILHWDLDHFVVLERVGRRHAWVVDPALGRRKVSVEELSKRFTGVALELQPAAGFERKHDSVQLPLSGFFRGVRGLGAELCKILILSLSLQVFLLVLPLFGQIVIDEIVLADDRNLLLVLGMAFLLIVGIQVCITGVRGWQVTTLAATLQFGWAARLFHHLVRLPMAWFEKRHMGDIVSRFRSLHAVEALVANTVVEAVVDGFMALTTVFVMLFYSVKLAGIVLVAVALYGGVRLALFSALRLATFEALVLGAKADSLFMESLRAILPLKIYGREALREAVWQNRRAEAMNAEVRTHRLGLIQELANALLFGAENVVVLWAGAIAILGGELSVGMLVAFIAYKNQFGVRAAALVDKALEFKLIALHLDRLADIAVAERDPATASPAATLRRISGAIEVRDLWFRYANTEPYVIGGLNLRIDAGECVAITGPSGGGKTTLLKLLMGLLDAESGRISVDGVELGRGMLAGYRRQIAAVMQDDVLLSGTLADNIACFDPTPDQGWMEVCAQQAAIHEDIVRMPMGYLTPVGDMGSALSGGQRQRICLARALYARPKVLFLDEATSHLDAFTEHRVHQALCELRITRLIVAHRRETLAMADRVVQLQGPAASAPLNAGRGP